MELRLVDGIEDFYITQVGFKSDTFMYDVKKYAGKFFLVLISPNSGSHVLELKDKNIQLSETNNITSPRYELEGYTIGDVILRKDINVLYTDQFGSTLTEEATLLNNENILLKIIAGKYIEEIRWLNISEPDAQKIIRDLNKAFTLPPYIEYASEVSMSQAGEILQYYWSENEENILLTKVTETGELDNVWTLTYTNLILSNIINNYIENSGDIL
jgi:archaellin